MANQCCCGGETLKIIFTCSGAADIGATADQAGRKLSAEGHGNLACLALVGAGSEGLVLSAKEANNVLVLDGCPVDCARKMLEKAGITNFSHLRLTDMGMKKGACPPNEENVEQVVSEGRKILGVS